MPPSTSSSTTRSACDNPCCGALASVLSSLRTRTGWSCAAEPPPSTGRPVNGQVSGSSFLVVPDVGSSLLSLLPPPSSSPPQAASPRLRTVRRAVMRMSWRASRTTYSDRLGGCRLLRTIGSGAEADSAVDIQRLAGDIRRLIACKETDCSRDVLREPGATDGVGLRVEPAELGDVQLEPGSRGVGHLGRDETGRDGVGVDSERAELDAEGPGEALHTHLGGRVVGLTAIAERGDARDVHDLAVLLLDEVLLSSLGHQERTLEVHAHDQVPVLLGHLEEQVVASDPRVVDEDVDPAQLSDDPLDRGVDRRRVG